MSETSKNKGGRPRVDATPITVRVPPELRGALDTFITNQQPFHEKPLTRPEAIRLLMQEALAKNGLWSP